MLACVVSELKKSAVGGRVERIHQPELDEIIIKLRPVQGGRRLLINAGSRSPRIGYTALAKENPATPPNFCMLLRKHLGSARLKDIAQQGFERVVWLGFECRDELGFEGTKYLIAEVMGKYSNLILADASLRIINALRPVDFTTSSRRQVLPGMKYELPPPQDKADPMVTGREEFAAVELPRLQKAERFIIDIHRYIGGLARDSVQGEPTHRRTAELVIKPALAGISEVFDVIRRKNCSTLISLEGHG